MTIPVSHLKRVSEYAKIIARELGKFPDRNLCHYITNRMREVAYYHHEKWDGSGYPVGLKGEGIPLSARIMALADVFDALSSDRPYRKAFPPDTVFRIIIEEMGQKHSDPTMLHVFQKCHGTFEKVKKRFSWTVPTEQTLHIFRGDSWPDRCLWSTTCSSFEYDGWNSRLLLEPFAEQYRIKPYLEINRCGNNYGHRFHIPVFSPVM